MIAVFGVVGTAYGAFSLVYNFKHDKGLSVAGLTLLILGVIALSIFIFLYICLYIAQKKKRPVPTSLETNVEEATKEEVKEAPIVKPEPKPVQNVKREYTPKSERAHSSYSYYASNTIYVKQVGHGPLLRFDGNRILDMRTNTYYRIEGNMVNQEGYGPVFEIRGNQIKNAFGGYLYELSGSNINKVYGGFYASISGNYITLYDLSVKYETTDSLSRNQTLAAAALLFGKY